MSLDPAGSQPGSGRSSPNPHSRRAGVDNADLLKNDKTYRRYAAGIEKALASFESTQQEWADYIAFLARLLRAIQTTQQIHVLPHGHLVSLRLAQCMNPALPSGVHQKALEVYHTIFSITGTTSLARDLHIYLPGLLSTLSFASLTVRPLFYTILDLYVLKIDHTDLRPAVKSIILALLPGVEDETSEDFEQGLRMLDKLQSIMSGSGSRTEDINHIQDGYFWQCFFLAVVTSPSRRQGALSYLVRRLPSLAPPQAKGNGVTSGDQAQDKNEQSGLAPALEAILDPEPGLLIRCFAAGLEDTNMLVQRGFLDMLVTHIPLQSPVLQHRVETKDLERLISAAVSVVLRRDMSLNRRLWSWFLGPDQLSSNDADLSMPQSPTSDYEDGTSVKQAAHFRRFGASPLRSSILNMLNRDTKDTVQRSKPYRICLSLMDRWEIGGVLVPSVLLPALESAFVFSQTGSKKQADEVLRSASLFFDGVESSLIWTKIIEIIQQALNAASTSPESAKHRIEFLIFVVQKFNIREEDMLLRHIPHAALIALDGLYKGASHWPTDAAPVMSKTLDLVQMLVFLVPSHIVKQPRSKDVVEEAETWSHKQCDATVLATTTIYTDSGVQTENPKSTHVSEAIMMRTIGLFSEDLTSASPTNLSTITEILTMMMSKTPACGALNSSHLVDEIVKALTAFTSSGLDRSRAFPCLNAIMVTMACSIETRGDRGFVSDTQVLELQPQLLELLWKFLSPWHPKHHVEAVRLIWQLDSLTRGQSRVGAQLTEFVSQQLEQHTRDQEACARFATLWEHTMQSHVGRGDRYPGTLRRASSMASISVMQNVRPETTLARPLMVLLDNLREPNSDVSTLLISWFNDLASLDRVFSILLTRLEDDYAGYRHRAKRHHVDSRVARDGMQYVKALVTVLTHVSRILKSGSQHVWQTLAELRPRHQGIDDSAISGVQFLAKTCVDILAIPDETGSYTLQYETLALLHILLDSPYAFALQNLQLEDELISHLVKLLMGTAGSLQTVYLQLISKAIRNRAEPEDPDVTLSQGELQRTARAIDGTKPIQRRLSNSITPPSNLLACIRAGLSSSASRLYLDHWIDFISGILSLYSDTIVTALIPLVECFCQQINLAFEFLQTFSARSSSPHKPIPVSSLSALLHGLELVLANAHHRLHTPDAIPPVAKAPEPNQGFFESMVTGFAANTLPSKVSNVNSRLTLILCVQDALRTCFSIWKWASHGGEHYSTDPTATATLAFTSLKLRNRTKRILENLFAVESLESLETLIVIWLEDHRSYHEKQHTSSVFSLLHILGVSKPRSTLPIILNALYSRTNVDALDVSRRSSLTCDLSSLDISAFLLNYVTTIEDDAMDEIWPDCTTFLRDVLSNPMPHRSILPALLEFIVILADKLENTNFGELRKMRRELGDIFLRLLTATFTARPLGLSDSNATTATSKTASHRGDLVSSLAMVAPKLQTILESSERVTTAVNSISTNVITQLFHARSFPESINTETLELVLKLAAQSPTSKSWKKAVGEVLEDPRFFACSPALVEAGWCPLLRKWSLTDRERVQDVISRIPTPSTAGIMFGVGANAARLDADRKTQLNLRRACILLLACDSDTFMTHVALMADKLSELCAANLSSSPSSATRAEVFMVCRAMVLSISSIHLSGLWPVLNDALQSALLSAIPNSRDQGTYNNFALLQACKLLDALITLAPEEFQLHEWLYITNTIDAVYRPADIEISSVADEVAQSLGTTTEKGDQIINTVSGSSNNDSSEFIKPFFTSIKLDGADVKATARDDFIRGQLQPLFIQLSICAYENTYGLRKPDVEACRKELIADLVDESTIV